MVSTFSKVRNDSSVAPVKLTERCYETIVCSYEPHITGRIGMLRTLIAKMEFDFDLSLVELGWYFKTHQQFVCR